MRVIHDSVPDIEVLVGNNKVFEITTTREFEDYEDRVTIKCAEVVPVFKRGIVVDILSKYNTSDVNGKDLEQHQDSVKDLVLVYVNKVWGVTGFPSFEYIFFK